MKGNPQRLAKFGTVVLLKIRVKYNLLKQRDKEDKAKRK